MSDMPDLRPLPDMDTLIPLRALDALEPDERAAVDDAIAADASLAEELADYRAVAALLAEAVESDAPPTPSAGVWQAISRAVEGDRPPRSGLAPVVALERRRRWSRVSAAISIAAVAVSVGLAIRVIDLENDSTAPDVGRLAAEKVLEPGAEVLTLAAAEGHEGEEARIVVGADGLGYVVSDTLPALPADRTYQLWVIVPGDEEPRVVSAGVLGNDPDVAQFQTDGDIVGFAITDEVAGGVPVSAGETVALWLRNG